MVPPDILPRDAADATLVGRLMDPELGPCVVHLRRDRLIDVTARFPTMSHLADAPDPAAAVASVSSERGWDVAEIISASMRRDSSVPHLLAPCDLQAVKACGVTFARSMLERVIEERANGDPAKAAAIRTQVSKAVGQSLSSIRPGTPEAAQTKALLTAAGHWSQYLEVGIGPYAEVFTKGQPLSAVGAGAQIGVLRVSKWNNPEPEVVLMVNAREEICGATLGNDVNLRDIEGLSALLLGKAKDNNASCALGPFIRLFDSGFTLDHVRTMALQLRVMGASDGFVLNGASSMAEISRDVTELVQAAMGPNHQYPDGMMLMCGTLFAPSEDRDEPGQGFTHKDGDQVAISSDQLGSLINTVGYCDEIPRWTAGLRALMANLAGRGLLA